MKPARDQTSGSRPGAPGKIPGIHRPADAHGLPALADVTSDLQIKNPQVNLVRFRPIMMTTMAALMGTLPLALGFGASAEARRPLGLAVVGGLVFSQSLTLYVTPVFYVFLDRFRLSRDGAASGQDTAGSP